MLPQISSHARQIQVDAPPQADSDAKGHENNPITLIRKWMRVRMEPVVQDICTEEQKQQAESDGDVGCPTSSIAQRGSSAEAEIC